MNYDNLAVAQLLNLAIGGSEDAVGRLLEAYRSYLKLFARVRIDGIAGVTDASDIVQDAFVRAFKGFKTFRGNTEPELTIWLRRILASCLVDHYRKCRLPVSSPLEASRFEAEMDKSSIHWSAQLISHAEPPTEIAQKREAMLLLAEALDRLPTDYREAIVLRQLEGLSTAEVAIRMGRTADSVRKLWARGMVQLRDLLKHVS